MVALWLPLLFKGEGRRVPTLIQTGFAARLSSSKLSPLQRGKKTFNKRWLVPSTGSPARAASSVPELPFCISLPLRAFSFCFLLSPLPLLNRLSPTSPPSPTHFTLLGDPCGHPAHRAGRSVAGDGWRAGSAPSRSLGTALSSWMSPAQPGVDALRTHKYAWAQPNHPCTLPIP